MPAIVDLAAMRDAMEDLGGDPTAINPLVPGRAGDRPLDPGRPLRRAAGLPEQRRARVRAQPRALRVPALGPDGVRQLLGRAAEHRHLPPGEPRVPRRAWSTARDGQAFPDTLVGTDSHTTMVNGLGVLGWGVGGIEAEAAMLGQPVSMLLPQVVGFRLDGELPEGATATDLVLTVTQMLRERGVVGKFVEFYGPGLPNLPLADRATIGNMSPEYGATCAIFPVDDETLRYLEFTGRPPSRSSWSRPTRGAGPVPRRGLRGRHLLRHARARPARPSSRASPGPKRPQDRVALSNAATDFLARAGRPGDGKDGDHGGNGSRQSFPASDPPATIGRGQDDGERRPAARARRPWTRRAEARRPSVEPRRRGVRPGGRRGGDRRDHELHEHLEPVGHARRRACSPRRPSSAA